MTFPVAIIVSRYSFLVSRLLLRALERETSNQKRETVLLSGRTAYDLDDLFGDLRLAHAVHREREGVDHVRRVAGRRIHRRHLRRIECGPRFQHGTEYLDGYVLRQQSGEQFVRGLLVNVVHLRGGERGRLRVGFLRIGRLEFHAGIFRSLDGALELLLSHAFGLADILRTDLLYG